MGRLTSQPPPKLQRPAQMLYDVGGVARLRHEFWIVMLCEMDWSVWFDTDQPPPPSPFPFDSII